MKIHLETKIGRKVLEDEPILPWLIRWAAMAVSRFHKGKDGRMPYQRQKGRICDMGVVPFGETVLYRMPEVARDRHQSLEERWAKGVWIGHARSSAETLIATESGVIKVWAIRRLTESQQWDGDRIGKIRGSPKQ